MAHENTKARAATEETRNVTPRAQLHAQHDDTQASPERELKVVESTVNDQDGEDEWRHFFLACSQCGSTYVQAHARIKLSSPMDCEIEDARPCPQCGLDLDHDELATVMLEYVELEYSDDF